MTTDTLTAAAADTTDTTHTTAGPTDDLSVCVDKLTGRTFDILWNGSDQFLVHFTFHADGTMNSNQTMFDGAPWRAVNRKQFEVGRKNGSFVLWEFTDMTGREAFRTDKKLYGMKLKNDK